MATTKLNREARTRASRKRHSQEEEAIMEQLQSLPSDCFFGDRFCGDAMIYSAIMS